MCAHLASLTSELMEPKTNPPPWKCKKTGCGPSRSGMNTRTGIEPPVTSTERSVKPRTAARNAGGGPDDGAATAHLLIGLAQNRAAELRQGECAVPVVDCSAPIEQRLDLRGDRTRRIGRAAHG